MTNVVYAVALPVALFDTDIMFVLQKINVLLSLLIALLHECV